jgi:hypothetical protein
MQPPPAQPPPAQPPPAQPPPGPPPAAPPETCAAQYIKCGGTCVFENPSRCGAACQPCPTRPNAEATECRSGTCVYECVPGFAACAGEIAVSGCVSTTSNPDHCGGCGFSCRGQPCEEGVCGRTRVASRPVENIGTSAKTCSLRDGSLYWGDRDRGAVTTVSTSNGALRQLFTGRPLFGIDNGGVYLDGSFVYWSVSGVDGRIGLERMPLGGGNVESLARVTNGDSLYTLRAVEGGFVWYRYLDKTGDGWRYVFQRSSGGSQTTLREVTVGHSGGGWVIERSGIYWDELRDGTYSIMRSDANGANARALQSTDRPVRVLATDESSVYWSRDFNDVWRSDKMGSAAPAMLGRVKGGSDFGCVEGDDLILFGFDQASYSIPREGGPSRQLATEQPSGGFEWIVAAGADGQAVYWLSNKGHFWKAPR